MKSISLILMTVASLTVSAAAFADGTAHESLEEHAAKRGVKVGHADLGLIAGLKEGAQVQRPRLHLGFSNAVGAQKADLTTKKIALFKVKTADISNNALTAKFVSNPKIRTITPPATAKKPKGAAQ